MTPLQFRRALADMDAWSASGDGCSFVISYETPGGPGFHGGATGYLASWRPLHLGSLAIKITGSPFDTFAKAEAACNAVLADLEESRVSPDSDWEDEPQLAAPWPTGASGG